MQIRLFNTLPGAWTVDMKKLKNTSDDWFKNNFFYYVDQYLACDISSSIFLIYNNYSLSCSYLL